MSPVFRFTRKLSRMALISLKSSLLIWLWMSNLQIRYTRQVVRGSPSLVWRSSLARQGLLSWWPRSWQTSARQCKRRWSGMRLVVRWNSRPWMDGQLVLRDHDHWLANIFLCVMMKLFSSCLKHYLIFGFVELIYTLLKFNSNWWLTEFLMIFYSSGWL